MWKAANTSSLGKNLEETASALQVQRGSSCISLEEGHLQNRRLHLREQPGSDMQCEDSHLWNEGGAWGQSCAPVEPSARGRCPSVSTPVTALVMCCWLAQNHSTSLGLEVLAIRANGPSQQPKTAALLWSYLSLPQHVQEERCSGWVGVFKC